MFFARAGFVFADNGATPSSVGAICAIPGSSAEYTDKNLGDLLEGAGATWAFYAQGYGEMLDATKRNMCPNPDPACPSQLPIYPCVFDPSDNPFAYYPSTRDRSATMRDFARFSTDLDEGHLPQVSFVKAIGFRTEHPGYQNRLSDGLAFVSSVVDRVQGSAYGNRTLVLVTYDEGGGYFDHVAPPASPDEHPYGTRVPTLALGPFASPNTVSHVPLEHSSIARFVEWNWLGGEGLLGTRDAGAHRRARPARPARRARGSAVRRSRSRRSRHRRSDPRAPRRGGARRWRRPRRRRRSGRRRPRRCPHRSAARRRRRSGRARDR